MKTVFTILLALGITGITQVSATDSCTTWGCFAKVTELYTNANANIYVRTDGDESKANCTLYGGAYFVLKADAKNKDLVYSSLLAAHMANKKIQIRIAENTPDCQISYVSLKESL